MKPAATAALGESLGSSSQFSPNEPRCPRTGEPAGGLPPHAPVNPTWQCRHGVRAVERVGGLGRVPRVMQCWQALMPVRAGHSPHIESVERGNERRHGDMQFHAALFLRRDERPAPNSPW